MVNYKRQNLTSRRQSGFTLTELMVTIAIMAILVSMAGPSFSQQLAKQRINGTTSTIAEALRTASTEANLRRQNVTFTIDTANRDITLIDANNVDIATYQLNDRSSIALTPVAPSTTAPVTFVLTKDKQAIQMTGGDPSASPPVPPTTITPVNMSFTICDTGVSGEDSQQITINTLARVLVSRNGTCT